MVRGLAALAAALVVALTLVGAGSATITTPPVNAASTFATYDLKAGDFNEDGKPDLVYSVGGSANVGILQNDGSGTHFTQSIFPTGTVNSLFIDVGDVNGDGHLDVVTANTEDTISVLLGDGHGHLAAPIDTSTTGEPVGVAVADIDGDGNADVVVAGENHVVNVHWGDGTGHFPTSTTVLNDINPWGVTVGDFNHDGRPDIATISGGPAWFTVIRNTGSRTFASPANYPYPGVSPVLPAGGFAVHAADLNGDGNLDLVASVTGISRVAVVLGNGTGGFGPGATYSTGGNYPQYFALADVTGDGKLDAVVANANSNTLGVLPGNGSGGFGAPTVYATGQDPQGVVVADLNGDGSGDVANVNYTSRNLNVFLAAPSDEPPTISAAPADATVEATGPGGATFTFTQPTATDPEDGALTVACDHAPGSTFPLGQTTVTCSASDSAGHDVSVSFTVTVVDTTPPALTLPSQVAVDATSQAGATATWTASASDLVDGSVDVVCAPPSGSSFAVGSTLVTCSATDAHGNPAQGTFEVLVRSGGDQLDTLRAACRSLGLAPSGIAQSLCGKLDQAAAELAARESACTSLGAFLNELRAQRGKHVTEAQYNRLAVASRIRDALGC
jgi:hypothetical protein